MARRPSKPSSGKKPGILRWILNRFFRKPTPRQASSEEETHPSDPIGHTALKMERDDLIATPEDVERAPPSEAAHEARRERSGYGRPFSYIHGYIREGKLAEVKAAVQRNRRLVTLTDDQGMTPLALAVLHDQMDIARLLTHYNAPHDPESNNGESLMCLAAMNGHVEMMRYLASHDPSSVNKTDPTGRCALHFAALRPEEDVVEELLEVGADVNIATRGLGAPLNYAVDITTPKPPATRLAMVRMLLAAGARHIPRSVDWQFPIHEAASGGFVDVVAALLDTGVDVNLPTGGPFGNDMRATTPLHYAAGQAGVDMVRYLLDRGANLHCVNALGETALHWAASNEGPEAEAVISLLAAGRDGAGAVCARTAHGGTPLHYAAYRGLMDNVQVLLELGADPTAIAARHHDPHLLEIGGTPEALARAAGYHRVATYLAEAAVMFRSSAGPSGVDRSLAESMRWLEAAIS